MSCPQNPPHIVPVSAPLFMFTELTVQISSLYLVSLRTMLLSLPVFVSALIIADWTSAKEFILLDSAFCNIQNRTKFHSLVSSNIFAHNGIGNTKNKFIYWCLSRNIALKRMFFSGMSAELTDFVQLYMTDFEKCLKIRSFEIRPTPPTGHEKQTVSKVSLSTILQICKKCSNLTSLHISDYIIHHSTPNLMNDLKTCQFSLPHLTEQILSNVTIPDALYVEIFSESEYLKTLQLVNCKFLNIQKLWEVKVANVSALTISYPNLTDLCLSIAVSDFYLETLFNASKQITSLDLRDCSMLTDTSLQRLTTYQPHQITKLCVHHSQKFTNVGLCAFIATQQ